MGWERQTCALPVSLQARGPHQSGGNDQRVFRSDFCITTSTLLLCLNTEIKAEV